MDYDSVTDLPGIGAAYGGRLNRAGYSSAKDVYKKFESYNFDSGRCQKWLNSVCGANSRYSSMCVDALRESNVEFGERSYTPYQQRHQPYRNETPEFGFVQSSSKPKPQLIRDDTPLFGSPTSRAPRQQETSERILHSPVQQSPQLIRDDTPLFGNQPSRAPRQQQISERILHSPVQQSPERILHAPVQQSTATSKGSDISKAEVMQMMAEFRNKQDAMATQIKKMEQEKSKTDNYIKTLETKIDLISKNAVELQKRHDTKIATLTNKLSVIDRTEQYKNISSSIYLLTQKFDDIIIELKEAKDKSTIHCYVKALETRIKQIDKNAKKLQKQHDKISSALTNKITGTNNLDQYKEVSSSINLLAQKFDIFIKQQSGPNQDKKSSSQKVLDAEIKQVEHDLSNLTVGIRNVTKNNTETKEELPNSDKHPIEIPNVGKNHITLMKKTINHLKLTDFPKVVLKDKIVEL